MVVADPTAPAVGTEIWSDRPAVVVSNNVLNSRAGFAQIVYLSTSPRKRTGPTHVSIPSPDRPGNTMALCEQVHTVDASRLVHALGQASDESMAQIDAALALSLSIGRDPDRYALFHKWENHIKETGVDLAEEVRSLSGKTADERVTALTSAVELLTRQRDSWREIAETTRKLPEAMKHIAETS